MKTIVLEIDESYGDVLTISAVGRNGLGINVTTGSYIIENGDRIAVGDDGKIVHSSVD